MAQIFPSIWQLLIPNLNIFTVLGFILLIVSIMSFFSRSEILKALAPFGLILSIAIVWGISIILDLLKTVGGIIIVFGLLITAIVYVYMFYIWKPRKK